MKTFKFVLSVLVLSVPQFAMALACVLPDARVIDQDPAIPRLVLAWDLPSQELANKGDAVDSTPLLYYRVSVLRSFNKNVDPFFLLDRAAQRPMDRHDLHNLKMVANEKVGRIRDISCLEALLIDFQIKRNPQMKAKPAEFLAFTLEKNKAMRVYLQTNDSLGVSKTTPMTEAIEKDIAEGWDVTGTIHNHSFFLNQLAKAKPQGVLAPSATDVQFYMNQDKRFRAPFHYITNGFHTVMLHRKELNLLRSAK